MSIFVVHIHNIDEVISGAFFFSVSILMAFILSIFTFKTYIKIYMKNSSLGNLKNISFKRKMNLAQGKCCFFHKCLSAMCPTVCDFFTNKIKQMIDR